MIGGYNEQAPQQLESYAQSLTVASVIYKEELFKLKAGGESHWYIDLRYGLHTPEMMQGLGSLALTKVQLSNMNFSIVASEGIGAAPVQHALCGEARKYGTKFKLAEVNKSNSPDQQYGYGVHGAKVDGQRVLSVDDTISTASSLVESIEILRNRGAIVEHALGVVDRSNGLAVAALAEIDVIFHKLFDFDEPNGRIVPVL